MEQLEGRVAVVTGAASGIGYALAERCLDEGMRVVLADVEAPALGRAMSALDAGGERTRAVRTDVSRWEDVAALADAAYDAFGAVHVVCNNAGVAGTQMRQGGIWNRDLRDWQWMFGVNVWGVVHGVRAFLPRMLAAGEEGHIVNTASMAGLAPANSIYSVTKHAVVAISEALYIQLKLSRAEVAVSVLCPGPVDTNILDAARNRPDALRVESEALTDEQRAAAEQARRNLSEGLDPAAVADSVAGAIRARRFYVLPMPDRMRDGFAGAVRRRAEGDRERREPTLLGGCVR